MGRWLRKGLPIAIVLAALSAAFTWLVNVYLMVRRYEGFKVSRGSLVTGCPTTLDESGFPLAGEACGGPSEVPTSLPGPAPRALVYWGVLNAVLMTIIGYRLAVGGKQFWADVRGVPRSVGALFRTGGRAAWAHLLWGVAVGVVAGIALGPTFGGLAAAGVLVALPSGVLQVVSGVLSSVFSSVARAVVPKVHPPSSAGMVLALLGTGVALAVGFATKQDPPIVLGVAAAVLALVIGFRAPTAPAATAVVLLALLALAGGGRASADDGGWTECTEPADLATGQEEISGWTDWYSKCQGSKRVVGYATTGAVAGGAGGAVGGVIGSLASLRPRAGGGGSGRRRPGPDDPIVDEDGVPLARGPDGRYWWPGDGGRWVTRDQAIALVDEVVAAREAERARAAGIAERNRQASDQWSRDKQREAAASEVLHAQRVAAERAAGEAAATARQRLVDGARRLGASQGGDLQARVEALIRSGDLDALRVLYAEELTGQIQSGQRAAADALAAADRWGKAERVARVTLAASRGAFMVAAGPYGAAAAGFGMGVISAAADGAESYVRGDETGEVLARSAFGFLSGAKDGALSVYGGGAGRVGRVVVPAGADAGETYARARMDGATHEEALRQAGTAAATSAASTVIGDKIDALDGAAGREAGQLALGAGVGGVTSVANGGTFADGATDALEAAAAGRFGSEAGGRATHRAEQARIARQREERREAYARVLGTKPPEAEVPQAWLDKAGAVTPKDAIDLLADTRTSRTIKESNDPRVAALRDEIGRVRAEAYDRADQRTIDAMRPVLEANGLIAPGETLSMDRFSTPRPGGGSDTSFSVDRDGRLVVERVDEYGKPYKQEIDRRYWENQARKDFFDTTAPFGMSDEFHAKVTELQYLRASGMSDDEITHLAWAETHNQLFTDRSHVEASKDFSDQLATWHGQLELGAGTAPAARIAGIGSQVAPPPFAVERLTDPTGLAMMGDEKSRFYFDAGNEPEALAQAQKHLDLQARLYTGYERQGFETPPLSPREQQAMAIIKSAPTGVDATPEAMAQVRRDLAAAYGRDGEMPIEDALGHLTARTEALKLSRPYEPATQPPNLSAADLARIVRADAPSGEPHAPDA